MAVSLTILVCWALMRTPLMRRGARLPDASAPGAGVATSLGLCAVSVAIWFLDPYAALLFALPLNCWMLAVISGARPATRVWLVLIGLLPAALVAGTYMHELSLEAFIGPAIVADVRHRGPKQAITADDLGQSTGDRLQHGDRLLLRSDANDHYDGSPEWMARAPYLADDAIEWCAAHGVSLVGFDFYHAAEPVQDRNNCTTRKLLERDILTMPYLTNLSAIRAKRFLLIALPLKMKDVEASPVRAVAVEE